MQEMIGQKFFKWTICGLGGRSKGGNILYRCRCECGVEKNAVLSRLKKGDSKQCRACLTLERIKTAPDLTGSRFGKWLVTEKIRDTRNKFAYRCMCDCGETKVVSSYDLKSGKSTKCGRCKFTTHGMSGEKIFRTWLSMFQRCTNPNHLSYKNYGGRGIKICERWLKFENFYLDMGNKPLNSLQIDRINNDGNYEPGNCRWATPKENINNRRVSKKKE